MTAAQHDPDQDAAGRRRPDGHDAALVVFFAAVYAVAAVAGRHTVLEGGQVSLVWPAAGVSVLWLVSRARRPWPWLDVAALALVTWVVVMFTGASWRLAAIGALATCAQAVVCAVILALRCPRVWAARGSRQLARVEELWWFLFAALASSVLSAPLAVWAVQLGGAPWSWDVGLLWSARNAVSVMCVGTLGFGLGSWLRRRRSPRAPVVRAPGRWWAAPQIGGYAAALVLTPVLYIAWFVQFGHIALVFPLIALTVWLGSRLRTRFVVLHNTAVAVTTISLALVGIGPFLSLPSVTAQVSVAQLYVGLVVAIGMSLALARDEHGRLLVALAAAHDHAQSQATLLSTIVDIMSEGVRVVDRTGRVLVRNPAATRLLTGLPRLVGESDGSDLASLFRIDGSPLPEQELPYRQALAGKQVRDLDLLVRTPGAPEPRTVTFTSTLMPDASGGGVVTVLRDVTAERAELRRAAQVQESLLPTHTPRVPGYQLAARFVPAGSVGGDFYDWQAVPGGLVVTLADVMGKGSGAAILAATTRSVLHTHGAGADVLATVSATERAMEDDLVNAGAFVTMFQVHLETTTGTLTYSDAGHGLTMILRPDGSHERLSANGLPLGIGPDPHRTASTAHLDRGDTLLTFSDGVLDAVGGSIGDLARVATVAHAASTADGVVDAVLALVDDAGPQPDDLTVIALVRTGGGAAGARRGARRSEVPSPRG